MGIRWLSTLFCHSSSTLDVVYGFGIRLSTILMESSDKPWRDSTCSFVDSITCANSMALFSVRVPPSLRSFRSAGLLCRPQTRLFQTVFVSYLPKLQRVACHLSSATNCTTDLPAISLCLWNLNLLAITFCFGW